MKSLFIFRTKGRVITVRVLAAFSGMISLFFVFYTARLLYVTRGLTALRAGGNGTYVGAVAFPLLAIAFGFGAWHLVKLTRRISQSEP